MTQLLATDRFVEGTHELAGVGLWQAEAYPIVRRFSRCPTCGEVMQCVAVAKHDIGDLQEWRDWRCPRGHEVSARYVLNPPLTRLWIALRDPAHRRLREPARVTPERAWHVARVWLAVSLAAITAAAVLAHRLVRSLAPPTCWARVGNYDGPQLDLWYERGAAEQPLTTEQPLVQVPIYRGPTPPPDAQACP